MRDLRTEELFIGAWVRVWLSDQKEMSRPMMVTGIMSDDDGVLVYISGDGSHLSSRLENVKPLMITSQTLRDFGFKKTGTRGVFAYNVDGVRLTVAIRPTFEGECCRRCAISGRFNSWNEEIRCIHELQGWLFDKVGLPYSIKIPFEWHDSGPEREEL